MIKNVFISCIDYIVLFIVLFLLLGFAVVYSDAMFPLFLAVWVFDCALQYRNGRRLFTEMENIFAGIATIILPPAGIVALLFAIPGYGDLVLLPAYILCDTFGFSKDIEMCFLTLALHLLPLACLVAGTLQTRFEKNNKSENDFVS